MSYQRAQHLYPKLLEEAEVFAGGVLGAVQSSKMTEGGIQTNRYFALLNARQGQAMEERLPEFLSKVAAPPELLGLIAPLLSEFRLWSIGAACDFGECEFKVYLISRFKLDVDSSIVSLEWQPLNSESIARKNYEGITWVHPYELREIVRHAIPSASVGGSRTRTDRFVETCWTILEKTGPAIAAHRVRERGAARVSVDFNLGSAGSASICDLVPELEVVAELLGLRDEVYTRWLSEALPMRLGHFAIGIGRSKAPFVTFYDWKAKRCPRGYQSTPSRR